jgi:transketolase C-terminal domain/subunit
MEALADNLQPSQFPLIHRIGLPDEFMKDYGTQNSLMKQLDLLSPQIFEKVKSLLCKN